MNDQYFIDDRSAGILLHITSLPGPAFIGDIGPAAREFADFLHRSNQTVWQMLPVQPIGADQAYSPYSSRSAMAGNELLISPELLVKDRLLNPTHLKKGSPRDTQVYFDKAKVYKEKLLNEAWKTWKQQANASEKTAFINYCSVEDYWLNDFALYTLFKLLHNNTAWYEWPEDFKDRNSATLQKFTKSHEDELNRIKWVQMIFDRQWKALRTFCDALQIKLLGDVPIYVAHDSADVWSHRDLFTIDDDGQLIEVSGVPPDLFNDEGQLWGMPLFKWHVVKEKGYDWWIRRLRKNLEWFDIIRLDHFRGFSSYWSVGAKAKSAKEGKWVNGPGNDFFDSIKNELGQLPFVAEDLGEIDQAVYQLRDAFELPGMNVLQFAFGDDMPKSNYLPHHYSSNSVVYTGTHDNNTTAGWFKEIGKAEKKNVAGYLGSSITTKNVAAEMSRLAYMSVSKLAMLPMQDVLSLNATARMNMPATANGNWKWRLRKDQVTPVVENMLSEWCFYYDRMRKT